MKIIIVFALLLLSLHTAFAEEGAKSDVDQANSYYTQKKYPEALALYLKASKLSAQDLTTEEDGNCNNGSVWFRIGDMYAKGLGTTQDDNKAFPWYKKAASREDRHRGAFAWPQKMAELYSLGKGVGQDFTQSVHWYLKAEEYGAFIDDFVAVSDERHLRLKALVDAAERNNYSAILLLGRFYFTGNKLVQQDYTQAFKWYMQAAQLKHEDVPEIINAIAFMYYTGQGTTQDRAQALTWYLKLKSDVAPRTELAFIYFYGQGTPVNYTEAYTWFLLAYGQDSIDWPESGQPTLSKESFLRHLTPAELSKAEEAAKRWQEANPDPMCIC